MLLNVIVITCHHHPAGVVLVIGATAWQRQLICAELARADPSLTPPTDINNEVPAWQRTQLYEAGSSSSSTSNGTAQQQQQQQAAHATSDDLGSGSTAAENAAAAGSSDRKCAACFVTTRILVVDILSHRVKPSQIAGDRLSNTATAWQQV